MQTILVIWGPFGGWDMTSFYLHDLYVGCQTCGEPGMCYEVLLEVKPVFERLSMHDILISSGNQTWQWKWTIYR